MVLKARLGRQHRSQVMHSDSSSCSGSSNRRRLGTHVGIDVVHVVNVVRCKRNQASKEAKKQPSKEWQL
jgi:hypothetical protein